MENTLTTRKLNDYAVEILANFTSDPEMDGSTLKTAMDVFDGTETASRYTHVVEYLEATQNLSASQNTAIRGLLV